jgi:hypothetical protein
MLSSTRLVAVADFKSTLCNERRQHVPNNLHRSKHTSSSARMKNVIKSWKDSQKKVNPDKTMGDLLEPASNSDDDEPPPPKPARKRKAPQKRKASTDSAAPKAKKPRKPRKPKSKEIVETDASDAAEDVVPQRPRAKSTRKVSRKATYTVPGPSDED